MGMEENWQRFVHSSKAKSKCHTKAAAYWDSLHNVISLAIIFLGAITTFLSLLKPVPPYVVSAVAAVATFVSAISGFMRPSERRKKQLECAKEYKILMMKMVRCEKECEYEELWREMNKIMIEAPFIPKKFLKDEIKFEWSTTPELQLVIAQKNIEIDSELEKLGRDSTQDAKSIAGNSKED